MRSEDATSLELCRIRAHYRRAERAIKRCERIAVAVPTPALNQLRYAGNHLLKALTTTAAEVRNAELALVEEHCRRAWFDAFDAIACNHLVTIKDFADKGYPGDVIRKNIANYDENVAFARKLYPVFLDVKSVQDMTATERLHRLRCMSRLTFFIADIQRVGGSLDSVARRIDEERRLRAERRDFVMGLTSFAVSVLGAVFSAAGLLTSPMIWAVVFGWIGIVAFAAIAIISALMIVQNLRAES